MKIAVVLKWDNVCVQLQIIVFNGFIHNHRLKYLGATLDHTLSFKTHLKNTMAKLSNGNNVIQKLCGTSRDASARTSTGSKFSLYSAAEYRSPVQLNGMIVWRSTNLNDVVRLISDDMKSALCTRPLFKLALVVSVLERLTLGSLIHAFSFFIYYTIVLFRHSVGEATALWCCGYTKNRSFDNACSTEDTFIIKPMYNVKVFNRRVVTHTFTSVP